MYNKESEDSIIEHGKKIEGKSLNQYIAESSPTFMRDSESIIALSSYNTGKGSLGQLVEEVVFEYSINSSNAADFDKVGMELKVVPLKVIKKNSKSASKKEGLSVKERISLTQIDYETLVLETWEDKSLDKKLMKILMMFYIHSKSEHMMDYKFRLIEKWEPTHADLSVIKEDWITITEKVKAGLAHELSEGDTLYLGAATKGASSKTLRRQPYSEIKAKQRAFSLKRNFVEVIFNEMLSKEKRSFKKELTLFELTSLIIGQYSGMTIKEILKVNNLDKSEAKNWLNIMCKQLIELELGEKIKDSNTLKKAGVELKTILLQTNNVPKEGMSFEQIKYDEIVTEEWGNSNVRELFENKKHLWIVFKSKIKYSKQKELSTSDIVLDSVLIWNMPYNDLEGPYKDLWNDTVNKIKNCDFDSFMGQNQNDVGHIRPKAKNSKDLAYFNGLYVPKKSFWLNTTYLSTEIQRLKNDKKNT